MPKPSAWNRTTVPLPTSSNAANSVIKKQYGPQGQDPLDRERRTAKKVHHYTASNRQDEASHIADVIGEHLREGAHLRDHAVLYRMNAQSNPIETYFARAGIPYRIVGGQRFFDRKEGQGHQQLSGRHRQPADDVRLRRIINEPARKIGMTTIDKIGDLGPLQTVCPCWRSSPMCGTTPNCSVPPAPLERFYEMYRELCDLSVTLPLDVFVGDVIKRTAMRPC